MVWLKFWGKLFSSCKTSMLGKMQMLTVPTRATDAHTTWDLPTKLDRLKLETYTDNYPFFVI